VIDVVGSITEDIDECSVLPGPCSYRCHNLPGGYLCTCPPGHTLLADRKSCAGLHHALSLCLYCLTVCLPELHGLAVSSRYITDHCNSRAMLVAVLDIYDDLACMQCGYMFYYCFKFIFDGSLGDQTRM